MTLGIRDVFMDRSYNLFLLTSALLFLGSVFMLGQTPDVHIHDTYYVFPAVYLLWTVTLVLLPAWYRKEKLDKLIEDINSGKTFEEAFGQ